MLHRGGVLRVQILIQGASQQYIDQLNAPADAQNGLVRCKGNPEQPFLQLIPVVVDAAA